MERELSLGFHPILASAQLRQPLTLDTSTPGTKRRATEMAGCGDIVPGGRERRRPACSSCGGGLSRAARALSPAASPHQPTWQHGRAQRSHPIPTGKLTIRSCYRRPSSSVRCYSTVVVSSSPSPAAGATKYCITVSTSLAGSPLRTNPVTKGAISVGRAQRSERTMIGAEG